MDSNDNDLFLLLLDGDLHYCPLKQEETEEYNTESEEDDDVSRIQS